jgi:lipopolysaccharide export system protein LptC
MTNYLLRGWERLSIYLPVLLMGLFAMGTWWLVRSVPPALGPPSNVLLRHEADYFVNNLVLKSFDSKGALRSEVFSVVARHFPDTDTLEMEQVRMRSVSNDGRLTVATSQKAVASGDGRDVRLSGDVRVVRAVRPGPGARSEQLEYRGEFLEVFTDTDRVRSHLPVRVERGQDRFSGEMLEYDDASGILELRGQVRGALVPRGPQ